ncbi:immunity protein [Pantoea sp. BAV 3049]|uniref:immunity protein n=1 Tax=Pantoea sp. BAV 3049 TaxID=2654188 RepID=UPI00131CA300|nr:immunity protein [Pantoea sp. BAV 3049]
MIENESVEDVLLFLAPLTSYPGIDRLYERYNFEAVASCLLLRTHGKLIEEEKRSENDKGMAIMGPNWRAPSFMIEKKYNI